MTDDTATPQQEPGPTDGDLDTSRRTLLRSAAIAGLAIPVVAACGSGSSDKSSSGSTPADPSSSSSGGDSSTSTGASDDPSSSGGGKDLTPTSAIPKGGGKIFASEKVVVTQPNAGDFKCFTAVCTHMGCIVATVSGGTINCACHGSRYNITTGAVESGPAPSPLAAVKFKVSGNEIQLT